MGSQTAFLEYCSTSRRFLQHKKRNLRQSFCFFLRDYSFGNEIIVEVIQPYFAVAPQGASEMAILM